MVDAICGVHRRRGVPVGAMVTLLLGTALPVGAVAQSTQPLPAATRTEHVVLVITDGLRWQEVFRGAERAMMGRAGGVADSTTLLREFWRETPEARREALLPFVWGTMARQGQLFGDSASGSRATVVNRFRFSYPGYSETFTGFFDPRIDSNGHPPNPNVTVFEWLHRGDPTPGRVAAFATWNAFHRIFNVQRSGLMVHDGWERGVAPGDDPRSALLRDLYATTTRLWRDVAPDALMHQALLTQLDRAMPQVLFIGYGETDEWAHGGRYDMYLRSAQQVDRYLAQLWDRFQADPRTRDKVTLLFTVDHGRGDGPTWTDHGESVDGAEYIWSAVLGPDTPPLGVRAGTPTQQAQMAATVAALLGRDWRAAEPRAAPPLPIFR